MTKYVLVITSPLLHVCYSAEWEFLGQDSSNDKNVRKVILRVRVSENEINTISKVRVG